MSATVLIEMITDEGNQLSGQVGPLAVFQGYEPTDPVLEQIGGDLKQMIEHGNQRPGMLPRHLFDDMGQGTGK